MADTDSRIPDPAYSPLREREDATPPEVVA